MKSEELIEKLRAAQIDSETTGQPMRLDVKIQDLLDAFAEKDAQIASLKGEISKIQDKMCEDVFEGIMPSEHIVCLPLQQAAKRIAELKQSVSCDVMGRAGQLFNLNQGESRWLYATYARRTLGVKLWSRTLSTTRPRVRARASIFVKSATRRSLRRSSRSNNSRLPSND